MRWLFIFLLAFLLSFSSASAVLHEVYPTYSQPDNRFVLADDLFVIEDNIIFFQARYSINGGSWIPISLSGESHKGSGRWLSDSASANLPYFGQGEHYLIAYTCSLIRGDNRWRGDSWNCHDGRWQLFVINNTPPDPCNDLICDDGDSCTSDSCLDAHCVFTPITDCGSFQENPSSSCDGFDILWENNFNHRPLGTYKTLSDLRSDWTSKAGGDRWYEAKVVSGLDGNPSQVLEMSYPHYEPEEFKWICWTDDRCKTSDGRRVLFDEMTSFGTGRSQLRGAGPGSGGGQWSVKIPSSYTAYVSYRIRFSDGFNPVSGGKIPGLCGGHCPGGGQNTDNDGDGTSDGFSARMMFNAQRDETFPISTRFYVYHPNRPNADSGGPGESQIWSNGFYDGRWHTVVQKVTMNNLNNPGGCLEGWLDGVQVTKKCGYNFRQGDSENFMIDAFRFSTFFGGSDKRICSDSEIASGKVGCAYYDNGDPYYYYTPRKDEYIHFDDIVVYRYSGSNPDEAIWPPKAGNPLNPSCP